MDFDVAYAIEILPALLRGAVVTIEATIGGFAIAVVVGLGIAILRFSNRRMLTLAAGAYIYFFRSTPLLVLVFFGFYGLPYLGVSLPALFTGIVAIGLNYGAYTAEVYRGGILSVPRGQWEAATVLNLGPMRTWVGVIIPQIVRPVLAPLGNYAIGMYKDTPLLATITIKELLGAALDQASTTFRFLEPLALVGLIFLAMSYPLSRVVLRLENLADH